MRDPWFQAFLILPPTICGVRLLPFSVAHDYLLEHLGNAYSDPDDKDATPMEVDLFEAVSICGRTWEENRTMLLGPDRETWIKKAGRWAYRWHGKMDFFTADSSFRMYLSEYRNVAEHHEPSIKPAGAEYFIAAPHHWHLVRCLCENYHMTVSQAWNAAFNEAKCLFDVWSESKGDDTLESLHDMRINDLMKEAKTFYEAGELDKMKANYDEVQRICTVRQKARESA